jgi:ABC-type multidrug transport system fused ATPase/permease subunit
VLDTLEAERLLCDQRYASQRVIARARRYGNGRLKQELRHNGVSDEDIAVALPEGGDETERCQIVWSRKFGELPKTPEERAKQMRFLQYRGFSGDAISKPCAGHAWSRRMTPPLAKLSAHNLKKRYKARTVVEDVSFEVKSGEVVGLLGPNGAGKTTCFYMIVGWYPPMAAKSISTTKLTHLPMHSRARQGLSYLPQEASVFRKLNVEENIRAFLNCSICPKPN